MLRILDTVVAWISQGAVALHCVLTTAETADEAVKIKY